MTNSTAPFTLYHHQRCSKSRGVKDILQEHNVKFDIVDYIQNPPTAEKLLELSTKGGFPVTDLVRFGEALAREKEISPTTQYTDLQWCELMTKNPALIERPIVETKDAAIIGRPPQRVLALLDLK